MLRTIIDRPRAKLQRTWHVLAAGQPRTEFLVDPARPARTGLALAKRSRWIMVETAGNSELTIKIGMVSGVREPQAKAGVVWIKFLDQHGVELPSEARLASGKNGYYVYLSPGPEGIPAFQLLTPTGCVSVLLGFAAWKAAPGEVVLENAVVIDQKVIRPLPPQMKGHPGQRSSEMMISNGEVPGHPVNLGKAPAERIYSLHDAKDLEAEIQVLEPAVFGATKAGIVVVKYLDKHGAPVSSKVEIATGPIGDYLYVNPDDAGRFVFRLHAPQNAVSVQLGFAAWNAKQGRLPIRNWIAFKELPESSADGLRPAAPPVQSAGDGLLFDRDAARAAVFQVRRSPTWVRVGTDNRRNLTITLNVAEATVSGTAKSGLLRVEAFDAKGKAVAVTGLKHSEQYGHYEYLDARTVGARTYEIGVSSSTVEIRVGVQTWDAADATLQVANELRLEAAGAGHPERAKAGIPRPTDSAPRNPRDLRVAVICDEFTYNSFKYEFKPIILHPDTWEQQLEEGNPDLFLCESAWSGVDSQARPWKGKVYASRNFAYENRRELLGILEWCREENVPTVFWNKEDPTHYPDREHDFVATAVEFDHVFTTDRACVEGYKKDYGHASVHCLPFATQPRLFNPIGATERTDEVIFAGSWYANHEARSSEMLTIFKSALAAGRPVKIYDRFYGSTDELHEFPPELRRFTAPAVSHAELAEVYKSSIFGLNINTVTDSPTMFARRVFELMSSNTLVLSNSFAGAEEFFGDNLVTVGKDHNGLEGLTAEEIDVKRDAALHRVLEHHTYRSRFQQILDVAGVTYQSPDERLTAVYAVGSADEAAAALASFSSLSSVAQGVLLILSADIPDEDIREMYSKFNRYGATVVSASLTRKKEIAAESLVPTSHFVLLRPGSDITPEQIRRAFLHTGYVDSPIIMGSDFKYEFSSRHKVADLVAPREFIHSVVRNAGAELGGIFYHV